MYNYEMDVVLQILELEVSQFSMLLDQAKTLLIESKKTTAVSLYGFRLIRYLGPPVEASQGFDPVALSLQPAALCGERHLEVRQRLKMSVFQRRIRQLP